MHLWDMTPRNSTVKAGFLTKSTRLSRCAISSTSELQTFLFPYQEGHDFAGN